MISIRNAKFLAKIVSISSVASTFSCLCTNQCIHVNIEISTYITDKNI